MTKNKDAITYQRVSECCNTIQKSGEKPSVRKINKQIGGSFSTIAEYLHKWQEQQALARTVDAELSDELRQAILTEFAKITVQVNERLNGQLLDKAAQLSEARDLLAEHETNMDVLKQQLTELQENILQQQVRYEKALSAAASKAEISNEHAQALQQQLDTLRDNHHQAELKAAVSETRAIELEKRMALLEPR